MIKVIALLKRKPGVTPEQFSDQYFNRHAALFRRVTPQDVLAGIPHYVQNHAITLGDGRSEPPYDCVMEMGFVDLASKDRWRAFYESPAGKVLRDDEELFMEPSERIVIVTEERTPR